MKSNKIMKQPIKKAQYSKVKKKKKKSNRPKWKPINKIT